LVEAEPARVPELEQLLHGADCDVLARVSSLAELARCAQLSRAQLVVLSVAVPDDRLFQSLVTAQSLAPTPLVLFAADDAPATISRAVQAGASAYVLDGVRPQRVRSILEAAMARFRQYKALAEELHRARSQLAERKLIERAKGIVMAQRALTEDQAYRLLRKTAMDRNKRMVDIAESIIAASELLGTSSHSMSRSMPAGVA
jgi:response regulator NasT